ncbi:hypothetical protein B0H11DRAFT_1989032 [Mycena galericulata]|nr:hypothetical protein B0H11DRAFT_1989032 [Mycena galericulata]
MSPFAQKLGTNYCPTDEELIEIQALIVEPALRVRRLGEEIAELQKTIDKLAQERDELEVYVDAHRALISPFRRLPLDIIQTIFVACMPTHRNCVMSATEPPVLLGRICSAWRTISLSTPRLWASLHIVEPTAPRGLTPSVLLEEKLVQRLETTRTWLGRSGQCPLSISLEGAGNRSISEGSDSSTSPTPTQLFLRALLPFASRWHHITFTTSPSELEALWPLAEADVPMLKSVGLYQHSYHPFSRVDWGRLAMLRGNQISSFAIAANNFRPEELLLRWNQLTEFFMDEAWSIPPSMTSDMILGAISSCTLLRRCTLIINDAPLAEQPEIRPGHPIVEFPFLHTLKLSCAGSVVSTFRRLRGLSLPELRNLTLGGYVMPSMGIEPQDSELLSDFFSSLQRLETLDIETAIVSKSGLVEVLRKLPHTMQHLIIRDTTGHISNAHSSPDNGVLNVLTSDPGLPLPCPTLKSLVIENCVAISDHAILAFITARMTGDTTLQRVAIRFLRQMKRDILPHLETFIAAGLDVSIVYPPPDPPLQFSPWRGLRDAPRLQLPGWSTGTDSFGG